MLVLVLIGIIVPYILVLVFLISVLNFNGLVLVLITKIEIDVKQVFLVLVFS